MVARRDEVPAFVNVPGKTLRLFLVKTNDDVKRAARQLFSDVKMDELCGVCQRWAKRNGHKREYIERPIIFVGVARDDVRRRVRDFVNAFVLAPGCGRGLQRDGADGGEEDEARDLFHLSAKAKKTR